MHTSRTESQVYLSKSRNRSKKKRELLTFESEYAITDERNQGPIILNLISAFRLCLVTAEQILKNAAHVILMRPAQRFLTNYYELTKLPNLKQQRLSGAVAQTTLSKTDISFKNLHRMTNRNYLNTYFQRSS